MILVLSIALFIIDSCKKIEQDQPSLEDVANNDDIVKKDLANMKARLQANPELLRVKIPINKVAETFYSDGEGNRLAENITNRYDYQCVDPSDMDNPPKMTLSGLEREYNCTNGYRFKALWFVSVPLPIYNVSPITLQVSRGRIRIKNTSSTIIYSDLNITSITITDQGDDPTTGNANRLYAVEYTTSWIPFSNFSPATGTIEHSLIVYTDCEDAVALTSAYISGGLSDATNPCQRIDPVFPTNAETSGGTYITNGSLMDFRNALFISVCPYPPGPTYPDRQQVQLKCVVSGVTDTWRDISPVQGTWPGNKLLDGHLATFNITTQAGTLGAYDFYYVPERDITVGGVVQHGAYKVRFRNRMNSGCTGEWSPEVSATF